MSRRIVYRDWDPESSYDSQANVETAVGVLMQRHGWNSVTARTRLVLAAAIAEVSVVGLARALLAFYPQHS